MIEVPTSWVPCYKQCCTVVVYHVKNHTAPIGTRKQKPFPSHFNRPLGVGTIRTSTYMLLQVWLKMFPEYS